MIANTEQVTSIGDVLPGRWLSVLHLPFYICLVSQPVRAQQFYYGIPAHQLTEIVHLLPTQSNIEAVRVFDDFKQHGSSLAALVVVHGGKKLYIFSPIASGRYGVRWKSPLLDGSFEVSSRENLRLTNLAEEQAISFSGCARHMCPNIFSAMVFVPSLGRSFRGTCRSGITQYDFTAEAGKTEIRSALNELLRTEDVSSSACSPETKR